MALLKFKSKNGRSFTEAPNKSSSLNKNTYKKILVKATSLLNGASRDRENLSAPEYNLEEIRSACESDSYIKMALMKYSYMLFKAGYVLRSENEQASDYIKMRLNIMSFATKQPVDILFQECGDDLIKYSNAILIKSRVQQVMPGIKAQGFFKDKPVGGYFRVDPATISVIKDDKGQIKYYVQTVDGEEKKYDPLDVVHIYLDRESGNTFGTPRIIAALEDVKLLRRIEGHVVTMIYRFAMPLFQWIIGLPQQGFQATNKEIDDAKAEIDNMALDGTVITNEKTTIKAIGAEGTALNAEGYLKYFEQRVFSALGVSESQMGRGGAKQDADSMESQAHDTVKHIQRTMSIFIQEYIINELLLEGGFNPILNEDDKVNFVFNEINLETKIKVENHEMAKFQSNMITYEEMRRTLGKKEEVDLEDLYKFKVEVEADRRMTEHKTKGSIEVTKQSGQNALNLQAANAESQMELAKQNAKAQASNNSNNSNSTGVKKASPNGNGKNKSTAPSKDIANKNTPENQHGKTSVKVKEAVSNVIKGKEEDREAYSSVYNKYYNLANDVIKNKDDIDILFPLTLENMLMETKIYMNMASIEGVNAATQDIRKIQKSIVTLPTIRISMSLCENSAKKSLEKLLKDVKKKVEKEEDSKKIKAIFESMEYRIRFMLEYVLPKMYWYSYLKTGQALKYTHAEVDFNGSEDEKEHSKNIDLNNINLDDIPPYHPFCDCKINFKKGAKK